jgi:hypothetical protein
LTDEGCSPDAGVIDPVVRVYEGRDVEPDSVNIVASIRPVSHVLLEGFVTLDASYHILDQSGPPGWLLELIGEDYGFTKARACGVARAIEHEDGCGRVEEVLFDVLRAHDLKRVWVISGQDRQDRL